MALLAHAGIAFAAKPLVPGRSVWFLLAASFAPDILSPIMRIVGIGTHNCFIAAVFSLIFALIAAFVFHDFRTGVVTGCVVFSHWIVDFITWPMSAVFANPPRMYLLPFGKSVELGLGLYGTYTGVVIGEIGFVSLCVVIYAVAARFRCEITHVRSQPSSEPGNVK